MKISVIIPAYNEENRIARTLNEYGNFFSKKKKNTQEFFDFEIIVVANACKDNTVSVAKEVQRKHKEIKILDFKKGGKGFAVKEGFKEALNSKSDLIGYVDADMATSPDAFYDLIENIRNYDGVLASRYIKCAVLNPKPTFIRKCASVIFNFLVRSLFFIPYRDSQCGAKIFKRKVIEKVLPKLTMSQWAFDIDLLYNAKKSGAKIKEIPTFWREMKGSKINLKKSSIQMFLAVIQLRILNSKLKKSWKFFKPFAGMLYWIVR
ncbi:MAG: glycosyltransferase [Nanoarchaeota archaeon]